MRGRFLQVDVLAGGQPSESDRAMPVMRSGHHDHVDGSIIEHLAEIFDQGWVAASIGHRLGHARANIRVHVAEGYDSNVGSRGKCLGVETPHTINADDGNAEAIVRPEDTARAHRGRRSAGKECASCNWHYRSLHRAVCLVIAAGSISRRLTYPLTPART